MEKPYDFYPSMVQIKFINTLLPFAYIWQLYIF